MTEPTTPTGRKCLDEGCDCYADQRDYRADILAIEREAVAPYARLAETGRVDAWLYLNDAVYHAIAYRIYNGHPPTETEALTPDTSERGEAEV